MIIAARMNPSEIDSTKPNHHKASKSNLVPLLILLLFASLGHNLAAPAETTAVREVGFQNNPIPLFVRGVAYVWALLIVLWHLGSTIHLIRKQGALLLFAGYVAASMLWSSFPTKVFINVGHLLGLGLVLVAADRYLTEKPNVFFAFISVVIGVALLLSILVAVLIPSVGVALPEGRWQGLAGNSNSLGMIAMISLWSNTAGLYLPATPKSRKWHWLGLAVSCAALAGSRSVTAILAAVFAVTLTIFLVKLEGQPYLVRMMKMLAAAWGLLILVVGVFAFVPQLLDAKGFFGLLGRSTTFSGRTHLWEEALKLIDLRPWLGWSFDSNLSVLKHLGGVGQFHSGYLDLLVRGGWVGTLLFLGILTGTLIRIVRLSRLEYRRAVVLAAMALAILLHNVTEASIARETHLLWTLLLFFYFFAFERERFLRKSLFESSLDRSAPQSGNSEWHETADIPTMQTIR